ncbi:MAG: patatin-like phospholipase family protein [Bdellovibrionales bacterium]|nr:patatin-like phospholipase family protein [Bdellovibrionales bacterium]
MKRRPRSGEKTSIIKKEDRPARIGLVLSGGGSRAAYQVGALKALRNYITESKSPISCIIGSSIGSVNGLILAACLHKGLDAAIEELETLWLNRTFRTTFSGSPSMAFLRAVKVAFVNYARDPGPHATDEAIFDPTPLMSAIDDVLIRHGGVTSNNLPEGLDVVGVMTTIEGAERRPLLFVTTRDEIPENVLDRASFQVHRVQSMTAKHGFASAALPTVLPPVELDIEGGSVSLVDGGISQNVPVDPAVRLGAERVIVLDVSGRDWWLRRYGEALDKRPDWEVPAAPDTLCLIPPETFVGRCQEPLGPLLEQTVGSSNREFMQALGATWPVYRLIRKRLGHDVAYETMTYVALHPEYSRALIERGYNETISLLRQRETPEFKRLQDYKKWY